MKTVLILGAHGRFGQAATQAFAQAGWRVLAQVRRAPPALPAQAVALIVPLADTAALARQAAGASVVVHAVNLPYTEWARGALPLLEQGLAVAQALQAKFMLPGNVYNYGEGMPALLSEGTPEAPSTELGRIRTRMEALLRERAAGGQHSVVIRAGDFFGSGSGAWIDLVITKSIAKGKLTYPGPLQVAHAWAYVPDLARAFVAVAEQRDRPVFETLHFAGHTLTGNELVAALQEAAQALQLPRAGRWRVAGLPWRLLRAIGIVAPMLRELARMSYLWRVPHALDGRALERAVGALPATPLGTALRQTLRDLKLAS
jgi:nucleoside-diphosphate-sugar epimerase